MLFSMASNWFIGLPAPLSFADALHPPPGVRLVTSEDLHLTLTFLGPVDSVRALSAFEAARCFRLPATDISLSHVVGLGPRKRPSAFSALLDQGRADVEQAMFEARDALFDAACVPRDPRPPLAHLTLARPRRSASVEERTLAQAWAEGLDLHSFRTRLTRLALYTWSADRTTTQFRIERERLLDRA